MTDKELYAKLKAEGTCTQCKKRKAQKNRIRCKYCAYDDAQYKKAKRESKSTANIKEEL